MDLRYCVTHATEPTQQELNRCPSVCAVSSEGVVAFTRICAERPRRQHSIAVADLNCPYHATDIIQCNEAFTLVKFSTNGKQLLTVTAAGLIRLHEQVSGALQADWTVVAATEVAGEAVLAADFLHDGLKPQIHMGEVKVNSQYSEKFSLLSHTPSLTSPGRCPVNGIIAVTASGLVVVMVVWRAGVVEVVRKVLGNSRDHFLTADIATAPDGYVHIVAWQPDVVRCLRVRLQHADVAAAAGGIGNNNNNNSDACRDSYITDATQQQSNKLLVTLEPWESLCPARPPDASTAAGGGSRVGKAAGGAGGDPADSAAAAAGAAAAGLAGSGASAAYGGGDSLRVCHVYFPIKEDPTIVVVVVVVEQPTTTTTPHGEAAGKTKAAGVRGGGVGGGGGGGGKMYVVQKYRLEEKTCPAFKLFKTVDNTATSSVTTYKEWVTSSGDEWCSSSAVVTLSSSHHHLFPASQLPHLLTTATADGRITTLNLHTMNVVGSYNTRNARVSESMDDGIGGVRSALAKRGGGVCSQRGGGVGLGRGGIALAHTWTGLSLIACDGAGALYFFSLVKPTDIGNSWPVCVLLLLEYSVVSGQDWWELLINTPPSSVTTVVDRLLDTLSLHPASLHTYMHTRMLALKTSILRLSPSVVHRAAEARIQAHLSVVLRLFRQLRPVTADYNPDKCASVLLTAYLENRTSLEQLDLDKSVDQFLFGINQAVDCQVEQKASQHLQPLLQYTADLSLYLLFVMAQTNKNEVLREVKTVQYLREVLFRGRVWYRHNKLVAPHMLRKTDAVDVWAQLYRLLTRLLLALPQDPDSSFMDEVVLLETQVVCAGGLALQLPSRGFLTSLQPSTVPSSAPAQPTAPSSSAHQPITPVQYQHNEEEGSPPTPGPHLDGALPPANPRDPLFYHYIPDTAPRLHCSRCWAVRGIEHDPDSVWEQEWAARCLCSGHWIPQPAPNPPAQPRHRADLPNMAA